MASQKLIIGLTGGIGSGKSTVAQLFRKLGITVIDADKCSRIVVEAGKPALRKITARFGNSILLPDQTLDRAKLRKIIFENPSDKLWLEELLHPLIFEEIISQLNEAHSPYAMLESPLLIEAGQSAICDRILVVDISEEQQIERAMQRDNNSRELIESILKSQATRSTRLEKADDVVDNSKNQDFLIRQVEDLHKKYLSLAEATNTN